MKNQDFGTVDYEGYHLTVTDNAYLTNRCFPGWFGEAEEGESYTAEYEAPSKDNEGNSYRVRWQFEVVKGQELEDEGAYPWDNEHVSQIIED